MPAAHRITFLESGLLTAAMCVLALAIGLAVGGLVYTLTWRLTHRRVVLTTVSRCPECGHRLSLRETIPVVSWVLQHGCCQHCGEPITMAYPACELFGAGMFASIILRYGITLQSLELLGFSCVLLGVALASLWDYSIPNEYLLAGLLMRVAYLAWGVLSTGGNLQLVVSSLAGAAALGLPLLVAVFLSNAMLVRDMTGFGTVKLVALVGLYLGWQQGLLAIGMAFGIGLVVWLLSPQKLVDVEVDGGADLFDSATVDGEPAPLSRGPSREEDIAEPMRLIPFAPSIALACWIMVLIGVGVGPWNAPLF